MLVLFAMISAFLLFSFIAFGVGRFGLLRSYSGYAAKWAEAVPMNNMNLWSVITTIAAFLVVPAMVEVGAMSAFQFLGFLVPIYLIVISLTPKWATDPTQFKVHCIFTGLCALGGLLWVLLVMHGVLYFFISLAFVLTFAMLSGKLKYSAIFWVEMLMFISVFMVLFMALLV